MKVIFFLILYSMGCSTTQPSLTKDEFRVQNVGHIKLVDLDNRTYAIYTKDKKIYLPINLAEKYKRDGLKVIFEGTIDTGRLKNVRLAGFPIRIDKIKAQ